MSLRVVDRRATPLGEVVLRQEEVPDAGTAWEIVLDGALLVTSLAVAGERALASRGLAAARGASLRVLVGGLGLGATAVAALEDRRVRNVTVVERLRPVLDWHRAGVLPESATLAADPRVRLVEGDVFEVLGPRDADAAHDLRPPWDVVLLDVDHSPRSWLSEAHGVFYGRRGLASLARRLSVGGVFALWSGDAVDPPFLRRLGSVLGEAWAERVAFRNPHVGRDDWNTVYVARRG